MAGSEWQEPERAAEWVGFRSRLRHAEMGERLLVAELLPRAPRRVLDLGCGDGHISGLVLDAFSDCALVGLDLSSDLVAAAQARFSAANATFQVGDLNQPLAELGRFDAVVSGLAIHHLSDERKRALFAEIFGVLQPGGVFGNLDVVASPSAQIFRQSQRVLGFDQRDQDVSDQPAVLEHQLEWMREAGFASVDCYWKCFALTLTAGTKP